MQKAIVVIALLIAGVLFMPFAWRAPSVTQNKPDFARKVNLALRRTAHHLLLEKGDSTSRIPAVQCPEANTFQIRLEQPFDYGHLPTVLRQSLAIYAINNKYDVALLDCTNGELQLGHSLLDVTGQHTVPCLDRKQRGGCYTLQLSFTPQKANSWPVTPVWWAWTISFLLVGGAYVVWRQEAGKTNALLSAEGSICATDSLIAVGQSSFNPVNQMIVMAGVRHALTYREAKLFHLFARHPNQLLTRDFILKSVWEDEGIVVGRSVDVFVSRLRKLLQPDATLRLVAVHGVGYRLEVTA